MGSVGAGGGGGGLASEENLNETRDEPVEFLARMAAVWRPRVVWSMVAFMALISSHIHKSHYIQELSDDLVKGNRWMPGQILARTKSMSLLSFGLPPPITLERLFCKCNFKLQ